MFRYVSNCSRHPELTSFKSSISSTKTLLMAVSALHLGIHALARQWNAVIISSTRKDILIKPDSRKHVVGRGVLTRKDREILKQSQNVVDDVTRDSMISHDQTADVNLPNPTSEVPG